MADLIGAGQGHRVSLLAPPDDPGNGFPKVIFRKPRPDTVAKIAQMRHWLGINNPGELDPAYREVYREVLREAGRLLDLPLLERSRRGHLSVLVSSPGVVTPYHLDFEHNFLCQITGTKLVSLWRPDDAETLSESEIEGYYCGNLSAPRWRPEAQNRALPFQLAPGDALYHPPLAPHWVKNGASVSISVSCTFSTDDIERRARIYRANPHLRRIGINAPPPGHSLLADGTRLAIMATARRWTRLKRGVQRLRPPAQI